MDYPIERSFFMAKPNDLKRTMGTDPKAKKGSKATSKLEKKLAQKTKYHAQIANINPLISTFNLNKPSTGISNGLFGGSFNSNSFFVGNGSQNMFSNFNNS